MTTEELLVEAKRRYPIGTKYKSVMTQDKVYTILGDDFFRWLTISHPIEHQSIAERKSPGIIHSQGIWAEIVSDIVNNFPIH